MFGDWFKNAFVVQTLEVFTCFAVCVYQFARTFFPVSSHFHKLQFQIFQQWLVNKKNISVAMIHFFLQKMKTRKERVNCLVQSLDENGSATTFDKICYFFEKEFLDSVADEMQVRLKLSALLVRLCGANQETEAFRKHTFPFQLISRSSCSWRRESCLLQNTLSRRPSCWRTNWWRTTNNWQKKVKSDQFQEVLNLQMQMFVLEVLDTDILRKISMLYLKGID